MDWALSGAGLATGFLVGLTGVGGGALMTPMLLLVFGLAPQAAVGTDLLFAALTKVTATRVFQRNGLIDWEIVKRLWWGSLPAATLTLLWIHHLTASGRDMTFLKRVIAGAILLSIVTLLLQPTLRALNKRQFLVNGQEVAGLQGFLTVFAGALLGTLITLTSVGAGALGVIMLTHLYPLRLTPPRLIATDIAHAVPLALFGGLGHMVLGNVDFPVLGPLLMGSIPGVFLGAMLVSFLSHTLLRSILTTTLVIFGSKLWWSILP